MKPIRTLRAKLILMVLVVSTLVVGLGALLAARERVTTLEDELKSTGAAVAAAVAEYSSSSLAFGDRRDAADALARLGDLPEIEAAALYDVDGRRFARFERRPGRAALPAAIAADATARRSLRDGLVEIVQPVAHQGTRYGTIVLASSAARLAAGVRDIYLTLALVLLILVALAAVLGWVLQRWITRPIAHLADVAARVAGGEERRIDVESLADDELGTLGHALDSMLAQLGERARAMRASHATLEAVFEAAPLAIIGLGARGEIVTWNRCAEQVFHLARGAAIGRPVIEAVADPGLRALLARCAAGEAVLEAELTLAGGERATVLEISSAPLPGGAGAMILAADVTERIQAELALEERDRQLHRAQQLELVGRLAGGLAHDFNNLLTIIMTNASLIERRTRGNPVLADLAAEVIRASERSSLLTRRLLGFSQRPPGRREVIDLRSLVAGLQRMVTSAVGEQIEVEIELAAEPITARVGAAELEQVILNLVLNARDAMPHGGHLILRTFARPVGEGGEVGLAVTDTGVGMSEATRLRATEAFFTTKPHGTGTGLGLATSADIVRSFGGRLEFDSDVGRGTTATVWLPASGATSEAGAAVPADGASGDGRRGTVLLVDDEAALRVVLGQVLAEAGYRVIHASDGRQALALAASAGPLDVLVTDVVMPGMTGPELARELSRDRPDLPVLYVSGYVGDALARHGLGEEAALLQKPFSPDQLLARLERLVGERPAADGPFRHDGR